MSLVAPAAGGCRPKAASSIDLAIRLSTAMAVLAVAGIAAYVSYWHAYAVVRAHRESGITARLEPATIDGLVYASSMVVLYAARHQVPVPSLACWLLGAGIAATLTANMAQGWSHGVVGAVVAAWPAVSLVGSYENELLVWLIRTSGTVEHRPPDGYLGAAACCRAARSALTAATDAGFPRRRESSTPGQARPRRRAARGRPGVPALPGSFRDQLGPVLQGLLQVAADATAIRDGIDPHDLLAAVAKLCIPPLGSTDTSRGERMISLLIDGMHYGAMEPERHPKP